MACKISNYCYIINPFFLKSYQYDFAPLFSVDSKPEKESISKPPANIRSAKIKAMQLINLLFSPRLKLLLDALFVVLKLGWSQFQNGSFTQETNK